MIAYSLFVLVFLLHSYQASLLNHGDVWRTIERSNGDNIDCIDKRNQPAFNNHHLKNHNIPDVVKKRPKIVLDDETKNKSKTRCPKGSVSILRTKMNGLRNPSPVFSKKTKYPQFWHFPRKHIGSDDDDDMEGGQGDEDINHDEDQFALARISSNVSIRGIKCRINVWLTPVEGDNEFSSNEIWLSAGHEELNIVGAGWHVNPMRLGSDRREARLFGFWTNGGHEETTVGYDYKNGGFIQTSKKMFLGAVLPTSDYGGEQYDILVFIYKNMNDGNWWLSVDEEVIGYWPFRNFTHLRDGFATSIEFGGQIKNLRTNYKKHRHTRTKMGSGHFAEEGYGKSSYISNLQILQENGLFTEVQENDLKLDVSNENCYNAATFHYEHGLGTGIFYGGRGYSPICE